MRVCHQKECCVIQRRTQTESYWQKQFEVTDQDISRIYDRILDAGAPVGMEALAQEVISAHCQREEALIQAELNRGPIYQPKNRYEVGQDLIFPALNYVLGTVVDTRPGRNPEYGDFQVIQVQIEGEEGLREFASELQGPHKLNFEDGGGDLLIEGEQLSPAELYEKYGSIVVDELGAALSERPEFVQFGDTWFLEDLLVPISVGNLNIAEALVEIKSRPLTTADFLPDLDLPEEASEEIKLLSLSGALAADERFDNVGDSGRDIWYLRRLTPEPVVTPPKRLVLESVLYDREQIDESLLLIEREIDDEGSGEEVMGASRPLYRTSISLIYPHWRSGTLPLTVRTRRLFPEATEHHFPIVLIDGRTGNRLQGWVVPEAGYVYGLKEWYERHRLPVGTFLKLERTRDPRVLTVDFEPRRLKSLWVPVAVAQGGKITFQMRKTAIACEYDDKLTIGEENSLEIDRVWDQVHNRGESLLQTMTHLLPELLKLSPQATVHAKTIYSAVNLLRRVPPGPIFALLSTEPRFAPMGGGYWTFDEALA